VLPIYPGCGSFLPDDVLHKNSCTRRGIIGGVAQPPLDPEILNHGIVATL
jgi:hypothetical protein